ncbi:MAG TPA: hypothetical protein VG456_17955, partial [Candidatus Sulfopaludibacter sp.]|nr:hypothetical protein [Candidatus Sulfopaludibacter sp.]
IFLRVITIGLAVCTAAAGSSIFTFASWTERSGGGNLFEFLNSGATHEFETGTGSSPVSIPITFEFQSVSGPLPLALQGPINAHMTISAPATGVATTTPVCLNPPSCSNTKYFTTQPVGGTITITSDTPVTGLDHNAADDILLQVIFGASAGLQGFRGDGVASLLSDSTSVGDSVSFTSDYLNFGLPVEEQISMSFTSLSPCFTRITNSCSATATSPVGTYLRQFTANGSGTFSADPEPYTQAPEPMMMSLMGLGAIGLGLTGRLKRKKK